ncbi:MAG TPA: MlaD family protein [Syntrophales bacterium]|nr:MlaD family protein [Syntrophales bacterium]
MSKKFEFKVGLFVVVTSILIIACVIYLAYSKGFFTREYIYTLSSKTGEDLTEGMPVLFSGYKIGRVETLELNDQGILLIKIRIPEQHAKWIRSDSTFSFYKPLIGSSRLIVTTEHLNSPELSPKTIPEIVVVNDINETIKKVQPILEKVDKVVTNIEKITSTLAKRDTLIEMAVGTPESAKSVNESLKKIRDILAKTDEQVYGNDGVLSIVRNILKDILTKLGKIDTALDNVIKISADTADSTKDLKVLRAEIDATVNSIGKLVNEIDNKIPFKKEPESIKLP